MSPILHAALLPGLLSRLWAAGVICEMSDRGAVTFSDGRPLLRASVAMFAPGWVGASNDSAGTASREGDLVSGFFGLPGDCRGALHYSVRAEPQEGGAKLAYTLQFDEPNQIQSAQVSFFLPTERFQGKQATLWPARIQRSLPGQGQPVDLSGRGCAISVGLSNGNALVIAGDAVGSVMVQDNRQWGAQEYEVRWHLFGPGMVGPGMVARRAFHVAVVPVDQVSQVVDAMWPQPVFDPAQPFAVVRDNGEVTIGTQSKRLVDVRLSVHGVGWAWRGQADAQVQASGDTRTRFFAGALEVPAAQGQQMEFLETASLEERGALGLKYRLHFPEAVRLNGYQVSFDLALSAYAGASVVLQTAEGERAITIPTEHKGNFLFSGPITRLAVAPGISTGFALAVDQPSPLLIQDNRGWGGDDIELRFNFRRQAEGEVVPAGETVERQFIFSLNAPLQIALDESIATNQTDTTGWVPFTLPWDTCPVDMSFLNHKPAGKYGFVTVKDGKFVLSDTGEEIRFWGTCFSAGANFPTHEQAEKIARRLARFGVNMVRTHHADAQWSERSLFKKAADNTREFDPESLDRFDYLIYCLKNEGIYIYLDQLVNRYFKAGDGVDEPDKLGACGKPYSNFDPKLIELQKEFSRNLWTHVNPYTGLAYKDDPAIALMEFANENDLFAQAVTLEPYRSRLEAMYRDWAQRNGVVVPTERVDFQQRTDEIMRFLVEVQRDYYLEMSRYLREEVGVRVPMTGSNWSINAALLAALRDMPYTDSHTYWHHPVGDVVGNTPMLGSEGTVFSGLAFQRLAGKPFFVSEWDEPWPNEWRAELPCWMAAMAAFQEWNGLTVYTYRHTSAVPVDRISGAFETFNDPARFGLFPHAALIFRRGDVAAARQKVAVLIPEELAVSSRTPSAWSAAPYRAFVESMRVDGALFQAPEGYDQVVEVTATPPTPGDIRQADTGEIWRSVDRRVGKINSPRSQVVFGFLSEAGEMSTADMTVTCQSLFATIALSSLTDAPIRDSEHLLLTAVGRAENTGFQWNLTRNKKIADGSGPILVDPIRAQVAIRTSRPDLKVWAIGADGSRLGEVPASYEGGRLQFRVGPAAKTMYYEIGS